MDLCTQAPCIALYLWEIFDETFLAFLCSPSSCICLCATTARTADDQQRFTEWAGNGPGGGCRTSRACNDETSSDQHRQEHLHGRGRSLSLSPSCRPHGRNH